MPLAILVATVMRSRELRRRQGGWLPMPGEMVNMD